LTDWLDMSILLETEEGWIISHEKYFDKVQVQSSDEDLSSETYLKLNPDLFEITEPFKDKLVINGKRVKDDSKLDFSNITLLVKGLYEGMRSHPDSKVIFEQSQKCVEEESHNKLEESSPGRRPSSNAKAVQTARDFFDNVKDIQWPEFHGQNPSSEGAVMRSMGGCDSSHKFIFLPNTKFYCKDVSELDKTFCGKEKEERFDVIVMDPPWRNKFIRRKKRKQHEAGYQLIDDDGIAKLPIGKLLKDDGLVVCWCTNAKSHQDALINEIFRDWNVKYLETWYWLKVTKSGVPICHFNIDNRKQPYEVIIIGIRQENLTSSHGAPAPKPKIVVSVPSSVNSHKPPLIDILRRRFKNRSFEHKCEVFARYLIPGFTSFGNEVIKLQHSNLFVER
ncbi:Methyltransferase-like protein 4, partial [Orchesella cincta]